MEEMTTSPRTVPQLVIAVVIRSLQREGLPRHLDGDGTPGLVLDRQRERLRHREQGFKRQVHQIQGASRWDLSNRIDLDRERQRDRAGERPHHAGGRAEDEVTPGQGFQSV